MSTGDVFTPADHVTEREPGPWRDCTFAALLEVVRDGFPDGRETIPATMAEKEALRAAAGLPDDHLGATIAQAVEAAERRYGMGAGYRVTSDWAVVRAALSSATSRCIVQGSMGSVPAHLRRWDDYTGPHAVAARGGVWCDPLAPEGSYTGELVAIGTWESFWRGLPGAQALITTAGGLTRSEMSIYERRPVSGRFVIPAGKSVKGYRPVGAVWEVVKTWAAQPSPSSAPFEGHLVRLSGTAVPSSLLRATAGYFSGLYVSTAEVDETVAPDPTPYSQADVDAAYAKGRAEGDVKHTVTLQVDGSEVSRTEV